MSNDAWMYLALVFGGVMGVIAIGLRRRLNAARREGGAVVREEDQQVLDQFDSMVVSLRVTVKGAMHQRDSLVRRLGVENAAEERVDELLEKEKRLKAVEKVLGDGR